MDISTLDLILQISKELGDPLGINEIYEGIRTILAVIALIGFTIAMIPCLFGFKLMKFWIGVQGFLVGGLIGIIIGFSISSPSIAVVIGLTGAVIGALIAYKLYKVGVFITFFGMGFVIVALLIALGEPSLAVPLGFIGGIVLGIVGVKLVQPAFILSTAISGGMTAGIFMGIILDFGIAAGVFFGIICSGIGIYVQIRMNGGLIEHGSKTVSDAKKTEWNNSNLQNQKPWKKDINALDGKHKNTPFINDNKKNSISPLIPAHIMQELNYVFDKDMASSIKHLPKVESEDSWVCSCGYTNNESECPICGMKLEDAKTKINYAYLNNHRIERLKQKELREKEILARNKEKLMNGTKNIYNKAHDTIVKGLKLIQKAFVFLFSKKNRLKSSIITCILVLVVSGIIILPKTPAFKTFYYNAKAESNISKDNEKATSLYFQSLDIHPTKNAYIGLVKVAVNNQNYELAVQYLKEFSSAFPDSKSVDKCFRQMLKDAEKNRKENSDLSAEIFSETLQFKPTEQAFNELIQICLEEKDYETAGGYIKKAISAFPDNSDYKNLLEKYTPEAPAVSLAEGTYSSFQNIEMSVQTPEFTNSIYYKIDNESDKIYSEAIQLDQNQVYQLEVWCVNAFQFESEHKTFTYTLSLPVPGDLTVDLKGGIYKKQKPVKITSPEGYPIYYTLDGSQPDKNSLLYTTPIALDFGTTVLKAVCYNDYGMESKCLDQTYQISYGVQGALFESGYFCSGYYYDYFSGNEAIMRYTKSGEYVDTLEAGDCTYLNEYGENLYYRSDGNIMVSSIDSFNPVRLSDIKASGFALAHDCIYYIDAIDNYLYRMELDGSNKSLVLKKSVRYLDVVDNQKLYFNISGEGVSYIKEKDGKILPTIIKKDVSAYYFGLDGAYYIDLNGIHRLTKDGDTLLFKNSEDTSTIEGSGFLSDSYEYSYVTWYDSFLICNKHLYFREFYSQQKDTISWTNVVSDTNLTAGYLWHQYNLENGEENQTAVSTFDLYITDNALYDQDLNRYGVIQ